MLDFTIYNFSISSFNSYVTETEWAHFMIRRFYKTLPKAMGKKSAVIFFKLFIMVVLSIITILVLRPNFLSRGSNIWLVPL